MKETFVGEAIIPVEQSFCTSAMAVGRPGLPAQFLWQGRSLSVIEVLEEWKESGDCRHGSGERYVRKHWFRVKTTGNLEMKIYFERQGRSSGGSRWRLYTLRDDQPGTASGPVAKTPKPDLENPTGRLLQGEFPTAVSALRVAAHADACSRSANTSPRGS